MFIFIRGVLYSLDPPMHIFGEVWTPRPPQELMRLVLHYSIFFRQCLLHRPGFQHLITAALAAAVVLFCRSIYYLSSWHRCQNPNSNHKILEKKKRNLQRYSSLALILVSVSSGNRYPNPRHCSQVY